MTKTQGNDRRRQAQENRDRILALCLQTPRSIESLAKELGVGERTIYRAFGAIRQDLTWEVSRLGSMGTYTYKVEKREG